MMAKLIPNTEKTLLEARYILLDAPHPTSLFAVWMVDAAA